ncbi:outer membrane lipoprotein carrier protein LolA [Acetobacter okinawensis]|uniref:LolA family protein n=1 Tax=Acetobacter okinawensis TaxID=1076594 RepID=UPI001BA9799C|nr:LolA-related protein [Acetobacter okinawensis]MBS0965930.1 outer membrane lipoprotein carrier protein LolA [Acetobacter okinawensis]
MKVLPLVIAYGLLGGVGQAWAADGAADLSAQVIAHLGQVGERIQTFHEKKDIAALTHPLLSNGVLVFHRPAYLEKKTQAPRPETLVIDGDMVSIQRGAGDVHHVALAQNAALALLAATLRAPLEGNLPALTHDYAVTAQGDLGAWTLRMTPISAQAVHLVRLVVLTGRNNAVDSLRIVQANGDVQTLTLDP